MPLDAPAVRFLLCCWSFIVRSKQMASKTQSKTSKHPVIENLEPKQANQVRGGLTCRKAGGTQQE